MILFLKVVIAGNVRKGAVRSWPVNLSEQVKGAPPVKAELPSCFDTVKYDILRSSESYI